MAHGFDNVRRDTRGEELRCAANAKAVASHAWISSSCPDLVASCEEGCLCQHAWTRGGGVGEEWKVAGKSVGCEVRVNMQDGSRESKQGTSTTFSPFQFVFVWGRASV